MTARGAPGPGGARDLRRPAPPRAARDPSRPAPATARATAHAAVVEAAIRLETGREAGRRAARLAAADAVERGLAPWQRRPPPRLRYPRYGWRGAVRLAVERRMLTPGYLVRYGRYLRRRATAAARGSALELHGALFLGRRVELAARPHHGRIVVGPWTWIGDDNHVRSHEGQVTLGAKVVLGRANVVTSYLDVEIGDASILADWIYVCDFDHRTGRLDVPIKDQGIVASPVRIGPDVWVGEKATILRGVDVGRGAVVASHALVNRDVEPFAIVAGVPARTVGSRLARGVDPEEALACIEAGLPVPGDPLDG